MTRVMENSTKLAWFPKLLPEKEDFEESWKAIRN